MKHTFVGAASALLLITGAAFAAPADQPGHKSPKPGSNSETMSAVKDSTAGMVGTVSAEMTSTTKGFVTAAATSDMYEVTAGKIALQRAQSPDVKAFAQKMVDAHTMTTEKLKSILASNDIKVTPPAHVDDRRQGMLDDLRGAKAADFDHRYIVQQIAALCQGWRQCRHQGLRRCHGQGHQDASVHGATTRRHHEDCQQINGKGRV